MLHPTHQGLADPPICFSSLLSKNKDVDYSPPEVTPFKFFISDSMKDKKYQDNFNVDALLGDKTSVSRVALQRCLGRWSNTTLFLTKVYFLLLICLFL